MWGAKWENIKRVMGMKSTEICWIWLPQGEDTSKVYREQGEHWATEANTEAKAKVQAGLRRLAVGIVTQGLKERMDSSTRNRTGRAGQLQMGNLAKLPMVVLDKSDHLSKKEKGETHVPRAAKAEHQKRTQIITTGLKSLHWDYKTIDHDPASLKKCHLQKLEEKGDIKWDFFPNSIAL